MKNQRTGAKRQRHEAFIFSWSVGQAKIRGDGSLSHAGMNRIRSQGLVSARRADTPSDPGDVVRRESRAASER